MLRRRDVAGSGGGFGPPPAAPLRVIAAVNDQRVERVLELCPSFRLLGAVRDAEGLRRYLLPTMAEGLVLSRHFAEEAELPALVQSLPSGWALLFLVGSAGPAAARLMAAVAGRPFTHALPGGRVQLVVLAQAGRALSRAVSRPQAACSP